jgi:hypothetical protein
MFRVASENNIDEYADSVSEFIRKCIGDVVPTMNIKTYPNQKPWIDGGICTKLIAQTTAFNHVKVTGNMAEYKQCSYSLFKAIKQAKCQSRDQVESQFHGSDTRCMWHGLQEITDYKKKTSHFTDTDVLLPDKLNSFFACFEDNSATDTASYQGLLSPLSFSVANVSNTFKRVNPRKAAGPDSIPSHVFRACADQLDGVFMDIFNPSLS